MMHYTGTIWRPPYEAESLLLEVTAGCSHHRCKFCTLYDALPFAFKMTDEATLEADVMEAAMLEKLHGCRVKRVFLTGANPFVLSARRLLKIAELIHRHLPEVRSIGAFARVTDSIGKTDEELSLLRKAGFDGLTIGMETGDDQALHFMRKGYDAQEIVRQCQRLERAGIRYSFFYLTGIAGAGRGEAAAKATAAVCNALQPMLIGANMLTLYPESALYADVLAGRWQEAGELEKYCELRTLVEHLTIPVQFGALGASNAFQLSGYLPQDRERILGSLDNILAHVDEGTLRQYRQGVKHL